MSDYFATKNSESDNKIQKALEARKNRMNALTEKKKYSDSRIEAALASRNRRVQNSLPGILSDIDSLLTTEVDSYNSEKPSFGAYDDKYESQRERRISISKLRSKVNAYSKYMDAGVADNIMSVLDDMEKGYDARLALAKFDSQEDYDKHIQAQKDYEDQLNLDPEAAAKEIAQLESYLKDYDYLTRWQQDEAGQQREAAYRAKYGDVADLKALIGEKQAYLNTAKRIQEGVRMASVADPTSPTYDPMFRLLSEYDPEISDNTYRYINNKLDAPALNTPESSQHMTDDEVALYNYYYSKEGADAAQNYLSNIQETLNYRSSEEKFGKYKGNTALELAFAVVAGLDQFGSGVKSLFNDGYSAPSSTQFLSGMIREDLKDRGPKLPDWMGGSSLAQTGYDAINTTANMAPSILASLAVGTVSKTAGAYVGNALMGASAAGNAYQEKLNMGYTKEQAGVYGAAIGASEIILEKILGGVTALGGGTLSKAAVKNLSKVDNTLSRFAQSVGGKVLINAGSEALEEGLQTVLEPYLWQAVSGEEASVEWEEALYSALMGAVTGGVFEGSGSAIGATQTAKQNTQAGKAVVANPGGVAALKQAAMDTASELDGGAQKALERLTGRVSSEAQTGKGLGSIAAKIRNAVNTQRAGKLYNRTVNAITDLNVTELAARLEQSGFPTKKASAIARATMETVAGYELDAGQQKLLESVWENPSYQQALTEIVKDEQSSVNQRRQRIGQVLRDHSTEQGATPAASPAAQEEQGGNLDQIAEEKPFSAAAPMRVENANGGIENGYSAADSTATDGNGSGVLSGRQGRISDEGSGGSVGGMVRSTSGPQENAEQRRTASRRQSAVNTQGIPAVSSASLGIQNGSKSATLRVMPKNLWDDAMKDTAERIHKETGKEVTYVIGGLMVDGPDGALMANGAWTKQGIVIRADHMRFSIEQIADHEIFHDMAFRTPGLVRQIEDAIHERYSDEQLAKVVDIYTQKLATIPEDATPEQIAAAVRKILEEIWADAYAGVNRFGADAVQFRDDVRQRVTENVSSVEQAQENGVRETNGPPRDQFLISRTTDNKPFVVIDQDILSGVPEGEWIKTVKENLKRKFPHGVSIGKNNIHIDKQSRKEMTYSGYMQWLRNNDKQKYIDKLNATNNSDEILKATTDWVNEGLNHPRKDNIRDFSRGTVLLRIGENDYSADVVVGTEANGNMKLYDIINLQTTAFIEKEMDTVKAENPSPGADRSTAPISNETISQSNDVVNESFFAEDIDSAYMDAVNHGDTETAQKMVDEAAKAAGYEPTLLYHGTKAFGFTEFDLSRMDDKRSIFLTNNERIASTYSGVTGRRDIAGAHARPVEDLSMPDLVAELNSDQYNDGSEDDEKTKYTYMSAQDINDLITDVNSRIEALQEKVPRMVNDYAERLATDFDSKDHRTHEQLVKLERMLQGWDYENIPTQLYMLLHHTDAFNGSASEAAQVAKLEQDVRLMRKLSNRDNFDGAIVESWLGGYSLTVLNEQQARDKLAVLRKTGNYGLYAKMEKPLIIDANGAVWNDIRHWSEALGISVDNTYTEKRGDMYALIDKETGEVIDEGSFAVNPYSSDMSTSMRHQFMVQKAQNSLHIVTEGMNNTREIAAFAKKRGFDGVVFRNLRDNGGNNSNVGMDEQANVYVLFNPNHAKAADPITYDNDGNVIPLSERFNENDSDIRFMEDDTYAEGLDEETLNRLKELENVPEYRPKVRGTEPHQKDHPDAKPSDVVESTIQTASDREFDKVLAADAEKRSAATKAALMRNLTKDEFKGTESLEKLGIRVENSIGNYSMVKSMIANDRSAKAVLKELRRAEIRLGATPSEKKFASGIAEGIYSNQEIPPNMDADKVLELADYLWAVKAMTSDMIKSRRDEINQTLFHKIGRLMHKVDTTKIKPPKAAILHHRTPTRNMTTIFGTEIGGQLNAFLFDPVAVNEAERYRFVNRMYDEVREFAGTDGKMKELNKAERALVQQVIEGKAVEETVAGMEMGIAIKNAAQNIRNGEDAGDAAREFSLSREERKLAVQYSRWMQTKDALESDNVDIVRINNAVDKYTELFGQFYDAINDFLVAHGYEPIGFIKGYTPHLQPETNQTALNKALEKLGLSPDVSKLPTSIAGLTKNFRPNKRFNPFFLTRHGDITQYDIVTAFESYVDYMSDVLYHTDDIMRIRQASKYFRTTFAPEEIRGTIEQAEELRYGTVDAKLDFLRANGKIGLFSFPSAEDINKAMDEYLEELFSNLGSTTVYSDFVMWLDDYANKLAGKQLMSDRDMERTMGRTSLNFANKMIRTFARAQVAGRFSSALNQMAQAPQIIGECGLRSTVAAVKDVITGKIQKAAWFQESDFLTEKKGVNYIANTIGEMLVSGTFKPLEWADSFISAVAVRSRYLQEIDAGKSHNDAMRAADSFGRKVMGSRAKGTIPLAFQSKNPFNQFLHLFQVEAANSWEHIVVDLPQDFRQIRQTAGVKAAAGALAGVIVKTLIAAFLWNRFSEELYGGTPAPFDMLGLTANFIASGNELSTNEFLKTVFDNCWEAVTGNRLFDTEAEPLSDGEFDWGAAAEDSWYNASNDIPYLQNALALFGLGDETLPFHDMWGAATDVLSTATDEDAGIVSYEMGQALLNLVSKTAPVGSQIKNTVTGIETAVRGGKYKGIGEKSKLQYPVDVDPWTALRLALFGDAAASERSEYYASGDSALTAKQTKVYEDLVDGGADAAEVYDAIQEYRKVNNDKSLSSLERGKQCRDIIRDMEMGDEQKLEMYLGLTDAESTVEHFRVLMNEGLSWNQIMDAYDKYSELKNDEELYASDQATAFAKWVDDQGYTPDQEYAIKDQFLFWNMFPAQASQYEKFTDAGLDQEDAYELTNTLSGLEPVAGKDRVTDLQEWRACVDTFSNEATQLAALAAKMDDSQRAKLNVAYEYSVSPDTYVTLKETLPKFDLDGSGGLNQEEVTQAVNSIKGLTSTQRAVLWQISISGKNAKNNPYSVKVGQQVLDALNKG